MSRQLLLAPAAQGRAAVTYEGTAFGGLFFGPGLSTEALTVKGAYGVAARPDPGTAGVRPWTASLRFGAKGAGTAAGGARRPPFRGHEEPRWVSAAVTGRSEVDGQMHAPVVEGLEVWRVDALCAQTDPEAFFPEKGGSTREAKAICRSCPVAGECLEWALANDERFGIWGGTSAKERAALRRRAGGAR